METTDYTQIQIEYIKKSIKNCYYTCNRANNILFRTDSNSNSTNEVVAISYLNKAISIMESCKAVYFACINELENITVESIFNTFETYTNEMLNNYSTNHSHQWTDIEFNHFKDAVDLLIDLPDEAE